MVSRPTVRVLCSLLAFGVLFGAGQAIASDGADRGRSIVMTPVMLGDTFRYSLHREYDDGRTLDTQLTFEWTVGEPLRLPDGTESATEELRLAQAEESTWETSEGRVSWIYALGTDFLLAKAGDSTTILGNAGPGNIPLMTSSGTGQATVRSVSFVGEIRPDCYFGAIWADLELHAGKALESPVCAGFLNHDEPRAFTATGFEAVDGVATLRVEADNGTRVWLADGIPYPIAVEERRPSSDGGSVLYRLNLTGLQRGEVPPGPKQPARIVQPPPPAVATSQPSRFYVDDSGLSLPASLSDALYGPTGLGASAEVATFLLDHPQAVAVSAGCQTWWVQDTDHVQCTFHLQDDAAGLFVASSKVMPTGTPAAAARPLPWKVSTFESLVWPDLEFPTTAPKVADLIAKAAWHGGGAVQHYGYSLLMGAAWVGENRYGFALGAAPPAVTTDVLIRLNSASFDFEGNTLGLMALELTGEGRTEPDPPLAPASVSHAVAAPAGPGSLPAWASTAGVGAVATAGSLLVWLAFGLKSSPLMGLFSRLREDEVAGHPMRRRILDAVAAQPGIHLKELGRVTGMPNGSLVHHARRLADAGLVTVRKGNGYSCYFLGSAQAGSHAAASALKSEGARKVLSAIVHRPLLSALEVERQTGLGPATVQHHLKRLEQAGLVRRQRNGRSLALEATWAAKSAMAS